MDDVFKTALAGSLPSRQALTRAAAGCLLGAAVGDAIGLPFETMSRQRVGKFWKGGPLSHRFLMGRGFCSDDTEHLCLVSQALLRAGGVDDSGRFVAVFRHDLAWRLRFWLLGLPAGIGMATLKSILRLWLNPFREGTGVMSAGNAPAMRSAIIGVCLGDRPELMVEVVAASTQLTHADPRAEQGALAIALAAWLASRQAGQAARQAFPGAFDRMVGPAGVELSALIQRASESAARGESTEAFAASIGCSKGVSGFVMHTVPVALHAWFRHGHSFAETMEALVRCGGDTDTTAAIAGSIVGAAVGPEGIPEPWLAGLVEWPRSKTWMASLAERLAARFAVGEPAAPLALNIPLLFLRNVLFLAVVLVHGFRRLLPPY